MNFYIGLFNAFFVNGLFLSKMKHCSLNSSPGFLSMALAQSVKCQKQRKMLHKLLRIVSAQIYTKTANWRE